MAYKEYLKDGRWQKKRLDIMQRDNFKCRVCKSENDLSIHHLYYMPNLKPWEYDNEGLITVCQTHHEQLGELSKLSGLIAFQILTKTIEII